MVRKHAYITDESRNIIIDFQFSPHKLRLTEGSNISSFTPVGSVDPDLYWVNKLANELQIEFFIDRSEESFVGTKTDTLMPNNKSLLENGLDNFVDRIYSVSAVAGAFKRIFGSRGTTSFEASSYDPAPHFLQNKESVIYDIALFKKFLLPEGYKQIPSSMIVKSNEYKGQLIKELGTYERFLPPPIATFIYGGLWFDGYISKLDYEYTLFNNDNSRPKRVTGSFVLTVLHQGTFEYDNMDYSKVLATTF